MNENQLGVILENILDKVDIIAEGQRNLEDKFTHLDKKVDKLADGQEKIKDRLTSVEFRLDRVESRLDGVESRLDGVESRLYRVEKENKEIKSFVMAIENGINNHEVRITKLEETL